MDQTVTTNGAGDGILLPAPHIQIDESTDFIASVIRNDMQRVLGYVPVWRTWMQYLAQWMHDNEGRSLLLYGPPGTGKTFIVQKAVQPIMKRTHKFEDLDLFTCEDINDKSKDIEGPRRKIIDGIGTEARMGKYANGHYRFERIVEAATRKRQLLIVTTNLYPPDILNRYGQAVYDRIREYRGINCYGESFRQLRYAAPVTTARDPPR